jgi:glycosyltransferase involved in cell wall biosynthesis
MTIIYCIPSLINPGGMERILANKVNCLIEEYGYKIIIVTTDQARHSIPFFKISEKAIIKHLEINFNSISKVFFLKKAIIYFFKRLEYKYKLKKIILENNAEICISMCGKEATFLSSFNSIVKTIVELHFAKNFHYQFISSNTTNKFLKTIASILDWYFEFSLKMVDRIVVLSNSDYINWKNKSNIIIIPNFISYTPSKISPLSQKIAVSVGRLDAQKGFDMLIDAWALAKDQLLDWELHIYGNGEWYKILTNKIRNYNLEANILLKGISKDLDLIYGDKSIFILSSRYEGFGLVLIEAMSYGLPVISFNCEHGPKDIIRDNIDGRLVKANDIFALSENIKEFALSDENRKLMGTMALERASDFSKKNVIDKWINLFKELVKDA